LIEILVHGLLYPPSKPSQKEADEAEYRSRVISAPDNKHEWTGIYSNTKEQVEKKAARAFNQHQCVEAKFQATTTRSSSPSGCHSTPAGIARLARAYVPQSDSIPNDVLGCGEKEHGSKVWNIWGFVFCTAAGVERVFQPSVFSGWRDIAFQKEVVPRSGIGHYRLLSRWR
jgi:hypothetical protein